jgi:hypothetical protein
VNRESPNEKLRRHIEAGWGKVVLENPRVLALAFSEKHTRTVDRGVVAFAPRGGRSQGYYLKALLEQKYHGKEITIRVPAYDPQYLFCFDENDDLIGIAEPEKAYHPMDLAGAIEGAARTKFLRRHLREQSRHCALLDLTAEAARHLGHLPEAPEVPVAAVINTGMLDRMADAEAAERAARADAAAQPRRKLTQWETRPNALLAAVEYEDDEA